MGINSLFYESIRKIIRDKAAVVALSFLTIVFFAGLFAYFIAFDDSFYANNQMIEIALKKPGVTVSLLKKRKNIKTEKHSFFHRLLYGEEPEWEYIPLNSNNITVNGDMLSAAVYADEGDEPDTVTLSMADILYPVKKYAFDENTGIAKIETPDGKTFEDTPGNMLNKIVKNNIVSHTFLLGTDRFGRDVLSRLLVGARISLAVGFVSVFIAVLIGLFFGSLAGFFGGVVDDVVMWFINVMWSVPTLLLVIALSMVMGKGFWQIFIAIGITMWVEVARVTRGQILSLKQKDFITAAKVLGYSNFRTVTRHILPNVMAPVIVVAASNFASAILIEAGLSFLGVGVQPPMPSWGNMIKENYGYLLVGLPHLALVPGIAIMLLVLSFIVLGNSLRDAMDVRG